jgi:hypothetical protein
MELYVLCAIIVFLVGFIVFKEILTYKERDVLTKKLMAKSFIDYANAELAETDLKQRQDKAPSLNRF